MSASGDTSPPAAAAAAAAESRPMTRAEMLAEASRRKGEISEIIGVGEKGWNVVDSRIEEGLFLLNPEAENMETLGDLIGMVVDLEHKVVISGSTGYVPTVVTDKLEEGVDGNIRLTDVFGNEYVLEKGHYGIKGMSEGITVRVFFHNGIVYYSSDKKLSVEKSRECGSMTFLEMYQSLDGPKPEDLFDLSKKYSPYVHTFLISTVDTRMSSKMKGPYGFIAYEGSSKAYDSTKHFFKPEEVDNTQWDPSSDVTTDITKVRSVMGPSAPHKYLYKDNVGLDIANVFLRYGFNPDVEGTGTQHPDIRAGVGEAVIVTVTSGKNAPYLIQVRSPAYQWRFGFRDENCNLRHQFYILANMMYIDYNSTAGREEFHSKMPVYPQYDATQIAEHITTKGPILSWPNTIPPNLEAFSTPEGRLYNVWACLILAVPFDRQKEIAPLYAEFYEDRKNVLSWLLQLESEGETGEERTVGGRAGQIITTARREAEKRTQRNRSVEDQIKANIEYYIEHEYTDSIYRLIRTMKQYHSFRDAKNKDEA